MGASCQKPSNKNQQCLTISITQYRHHTESNSGQKSKFCTKQHVSLGVWLLCAEEPPFRPLVLVDFIDLQSFWISYTSGCVLGPDMQAHTFGIFLSFCCVMHKFMANCGQSSWRPCLGKIRPTHGSRFHGHTPKMFMLLTSTRIYYILSPFHDCGIHCMVSGQA